MPFSPHQDRSISPRSVAAASSSVPLEQGGAPPTMSEDEDDINQLAFTLDTVTNLVPHLDLSVIIWDQRTSSTTALLELNMLDEGDDLDRGHQELSQFIDTQRQEAVVASKRKRASSPSGPGEATSSSSRGKTSRKRHRHLFPPPASLPVVPRLVRLVVPPSCPSHSEPFIGTNPPMPKTSLDPVVVDDLTSPRGSRNRGHPIPVASNQPGSVQGPADLVHLAAVAEQRASTDHAPLGSIKGVSQDLLSSSMPPSCLPLVPCTSTIHPYHVENERLSMQVHALEAQLAELQQENSSLTSALRDTSHLLEARQREVEQLWTSQQEVNQQGLEYSRVLDQFQTLERALPGRAEQRNSELRASLKQQQGLVDESNALAACQWERIEALQEEAHWFHDLSKLEGELTRVHLDLHRVATFAHCLYCSSPGSVLQHHNQHLGGLIEAMIALLWQGLDSTDPDLIVRNFQLVLEYLQASRGIHGELHVRTLSSLHYFFNNAADRDDGLYRLVLDNSRFPDDSPFATIAQHARYAPPFESTLEPPLHCCMFALDTALPYHGTGRDWEELMVAYVHHLSDIPLPEPPAHADIAVGDETVVSPLVSPPVPLFLSEQC
ncbi:hypothetical protein GG344DRAFT_83027 [Lentinula edodes]|nr:hypothetical protein GG344DRAFT_83027 [Lentinula edodes]